MTQVLTGILGEDGLHSTMNNDQSTHRYLEGRGGGGLHFTMNNDPSTHRYLGGGWTTFNHEQ